MSFLMEEIDRLQGILARASEDLSLLRAQIGLLSDEEIDSRITGILLELGDAILSWSQETLAHRIAHVKTLRKGGE